MRLVATPDGSVDRFDRALWLTLPFDITWFAIVTPTCRIFVPALENRLLTLAADDRVLVIMVEDRTYEVDCGQ